MGVSFFRKGLERLFGGNIVGWIAQTITGKTKAFFGGIAVGVIAPSSTGIALLVSQIASTSALSAANLLASLLGANTGLTIAVQLLAFRLQDYAGLFIIAGVLAF